MTSHRLSLNLETCDLSEKEGERERNPRRVRIGTENDHYLRYYTSTDASFFLEAFRVTPLCVRAEQRLRSKRAMEVHDRRSIVNIYDDATAPAIDVYVTDIRAANG